MVEKKGLGKAIGHAFLWFGIAIVLFPLYIALVATTHTFDVLIGSTPLWFGGEFLRTSPPSSRRASRRRAASPCG